MAAEAQLPDTTTSPPLPSEGGDELAEEEPATTQEDLTGDMGASQNRGTLFGGPHNKDYSILGSILGSPYFGKLPYGD